MLVYGLQKTVGKHLNVFPESYGLLLQVSLLRVIRSFKLENDSEKLGDPILGTHLAIIENEPIYKRELWRMRIVAYFSPGSFSALEGCCGQVYPYE